MRPFHRFIVPLMSFPLMIFLFLLAGCPAPVIDPPPGDDPPVDPPAFEFTGKLDKTFGNSGTLLLGGFSGGSQAADAIVQGNNLFVVGFGQSTTVDGYLSKVLADGSLDADFGDAGTVSVVIDGADETMPRRVLVDSTGRVVVALDAGASGAHQPYVIRYLENGTPDPDFGTAGIASLPDGIYVDSLALRPDGGLVVALRGTSVGFLFTALTSSGDLDSTAFDTDNNGVGDADSQFYEFSSMASVVVADLVAQENSSSQLEYWFVFQINATSGVASAQLGHLDAVGRWVRGGAFDAGTAEIDGYTSGFSATDVYEPRLAIDGEDIYVAATLSDGSTTAMVLKKFTGDTESDTLGPNHNLQAVTIPIAGTSEYVYDLAVYDGKPVVLAWDNEGTGHSWVAYVDSSGVAVTVGTGSTTGISSGNTTVPLAVLPRSDGRVTVVGRQGTGASQQVWVKLVE